MKNNRLLIISGSFPPSSGGPASLLANLIPVLAKEGFKITVLTFGDDEKNKLPCRVERISRKKNKFFRILNLVSRAVILAFKNDQIYAFDTYWPGFSALIASAVCRKRLVVRFTGDSAWETALNSGLAENDDFFSFQKRFVNLKIHVLKICRGAILKNCRVVVTDCDFNKKVLESFGVKKKRIEVARNSVDYLPIPSDFNKEFFKKQNNLKEKVILTVCRMIPGKGVEKILEILPDLKKDFPEISFVGLGGGPELEKLAGKSRELKNRFGVDARFLGDLPRNEVIFWYLAADAYILNTRHEGMAHTLLEAAYLGTPVATTGAGGNPEIIEDGHTGLVFDFNDGEQIKSALKKILFDNDLAEKLAANAGEKLKSNFSWKKAVEANLRILKY